MSIDYKSAGVDVEAGDALVDWLQATDTRQSPHADKLISGIGGFAAVFRMRFPEIKKPALVSSTDGVGTKVKLASHFGIYNTVGQDLVAMCVNDLVCSGARPLFFLDYYATGKLEQQNARSFLEGVRQACHDSDCALIGGETAEMPGVYHGSDFDCAGFSVGIVDEDNMLGPERVKMGADVIGVSSSGFHSNGFSLLRKLFDEDLDVWRDRLLRPTHLYPRLVLKLASENLLQAVAHITGGGMENIPRILPRGCRVRLLDWSWPDEFIEVQDRSGLSRVEMLKTLNCGVGLALIVDPVHSDRVRRLCEEMGYKTFVLGAVEPGRGAGAEPEIVY
ncbi:MAG: phosphoribosylformylglycinamidine cyclo-ligase [Bdellovibrionaceae bacterium]|nr:phosphoribosylformylglycinamidine cyclo-ligase [Pseudobdellovibrionaceae bacterium]